MRGLPFSHRRPDAAASVGFFSMLFDRQRREQQLLWSVSPLLLLALSLASAPAPGLAEVRLRSEGALLAARGSAEQGSRDVTFDLLHSRLAAVRTALQASGCGSSAPSLPPPGSAQRRPAGLASALPSCR